MGKKTKVGKQRKDKFYHLAKETGYRSRAAFKLIQLNRKFEFLQKSRVLVDLCAAPGGWMQVAVQHMPVSSIVIGVDLFPIKTISGTIGIQEDITTPRCLQLIKKELKTWKADVVLHDGAPNVGQNWIHDAYSQNCLTLSAFKLATEILRPGGFFVTKVFRSKDYNSLLWVLQQLFKNVFSTKPAASRIESAEIFIVCKGYLAPNSIDPKFLDPKHVFDEIEVPEGKKQLQHLLMEVGKKKKAEGYPTGETLLYRPIKASEFIRSADHIELLANTSEITLDEDWITKSSLTTQDIKDYCTDVKVLGRKEIKALVSWRKALRDKLEQFAKLKGEVKEDVEKRVEVIEEKESEEELEEALADVKSAQLKEIKKKRKKLLKERRKVHEKTNLKMIIPGDAGPTDTTEDSLFSLKTIRTEEDVEVLTDKSQMPSMPSTELNSDEELELYLSKRRSRTVSFGDKRSSSGNFGSDEEEENESGDEEEPSLENGLGFNEKIEMEEDEIEIEEAAPILSHPLITDLDHSDKTSKRLRKAELWFSKEVFKDFDDEGDEEIELKKLAEAYTKKGNTVLNGDTPSKNKEEEKKALKRKLKEDRVPLQVVKDKAPEKTGKKKKLDIEALALGTLLVESEKKKRDLVEEGWNRYAFNDTNLPSWFISDEKKHMQKPLPVPEALVKEYQTSLQEINSRPIKKVVEAKARKKKRAIKKLERSQKKAEAILEKTDVSESEKASQLKQLYKKSKQTKKKEVTYVVAKKFNSTQRAKRPAGVKGHYKVVDPRMKKDLRRLKSETARNKKKGGKKGKVGGGRGGRR